jgi:sigma-E factor negative regulatory protein RseC
MPVALEEGVITRTGADTAHILTRRTTACEGCSERHICHSASGKKEIEIEVANPVHAEPGDTVMVAFKTGQILWLSFLLYIFPVIALVAGALVGDSIVAPNMGGDPSIYAAVFAFLCFALAMTAIKLKDRRAKVSGRYQPVIVRIKKKAPPEEKAEEAVKDLSGCRSCRADQPASTPGGGGPARYSSLPFC